MKSLSHYVKSSFRNPRILKFALVGGSGVLVNMGFLYIFTERFGIFYAISSLFAIEISIITNFLLNNAWTWKDRRSESVWKRFRKFQSVSIAAVLVNWLVLVFLTEVMGVHYLLSNLIGIACGTALNFVLNDLWTFKSQTPEKPSLKKPEHANTHPHEHSNT